MNFAGQKCSIQQTGAAIEGGDVHILRNATFPRNDNGLSLDPESLATGSNGGCQATNLGVLAVGLKGMGILLGIDGGNAADGKTHFHGDHPLVEPPSAYAAIRTGFRVLAGELKKRGMRVINATPGSQVRGFEMMPLADALAIAATT